METLKEAKRVKKESGKLNRGPIQSFRPRRKEDGRRLSARVASNL